MNEGVRKYREIGGLLHIFRTFGCTLDRSTTNQHLPRLKFTRQDISLSPFGRPSINRHPPCSKFSKTHILLSQQELVIKAVSVWLKPCSIDRAALKHSSSPLFGHFLHSSGGYIFQNFLYFLKYLSIPNSSNIDDYNKIIGNKVQFMAICKINMKTIIPPFPREYSCHNNSIQASTYQIQGSPACIQPNMQYP